MASVTKKARQDQPRGEISMHAVTAAVETEANLEDVNVCWICLDGGGQNLVKPCNCPRYAHSECLGRWNLQMAGTRKETHCEFCDSVLPDWKITLTPPCGADAPAVMNVNFDGKTYSFEVKPGPAGYRQFTEAIRQAFHLPEDSELNITFTCDEPSTGLVHVGALLTLQGPGAYDAAVHCASVSAARRIQQQRDQPPGVPLPSTMHSVQSYRHFDATQPIPQLVTPPSPSAGSATEASTSAGDGLSTRSSGSGSSVRGSPGTSGSGSPSSSGTGSSGRKRWTGILTRRMRSALCEMWRPNGSRPEGEDMQE